MRKLAENANTAQGQLAAFKRKEELLKQQLKESKKDRAVVGKVADEKRVSLAESKAKISEMESKNELIKAETEKLMAIEKNSDQKDELKRLWGLVQKNEKLKKQEKDFKEECKKKMAALTTGEGAKRASLVTKE